MPTDVIGLDWADVAIAFGNISKVSVFSADNFEVSKIAKSVKGADSLAVWVHGEKDTQLKECKSVVETIMKGAGRRVDLVWTAGLQSKKQVFVLAGWKPKGKISKETLKSAVDAKTKELGTGDFDIKKWVEETRAKLAKKSKGKYKPKICKECGADKGLSEFQKVLFGVK